MRLSLLLSVILLSAFSAAGALPCGESSVASGYSDEDSVVRRLSISPLHRVEGIWRFPGSGATVVIERVTGGASLPDAVTYRMVVLRSENASIRPGTVMGYLEPSADSNKFSGKLFTHSGEPGVLSRAKRFTLKLVESGSRFTLTAVKSKYSVNLWRLLPYMFRYSVRENRSRGEAPQGCVKVFPVPEIPAEPVYL